MAEIHDHTGAPVKHGRARVNGIRMHYVTTGQEEPLLLLHGTPKTHFYWYKLFPPLTEHFSVVEPDLRGFGDTDKPTPEAGYEAGVCRFSGGPGERAGRIGARDAI